MEQRSSGAAARRLDSSGSRRTPPPNMDTMLTQLQRQLSAGGHGNATAVAMSDVQPILAASASPAVPLSAAASSILQGIDQFDLFASAAFAAGGAAAAQRRLSAGAKRVGASVAPDATPSVAVHSGGFGDDDPIPLDAPPMSDAVIMGSSGGADDDTPGSRVRYIGTAPPGAQRGGVGGNSQAFLAALRRATQSVYFEELQYQLS